MSVRDTGILRKKSSTAAATEANLLIVGYQSHIFRDDEKAQFIDQGRHLIGWMGDESLKIDRYDVRATLSDLAPYEAPAGGYANRLDYLSPAEQKAEQLCEEERYYSLYTNEIEEEAYQEELLKRQQPGYGQVGFNYDGEPQSSDQTQGQQHGPEEAEQEPDDPFEPLPNFIIPRHIELPETMRLNAIIEKTARFIAAQGVQMEILIKAKQSNNPQFDFLNMNGHCNAYYKFVVNAIKEGQYPDRPPPTPTTPAAPPNDNGESRDGEKKKKAKDTTNGEANSSKVTIVPTIKYVPSEDCSYTQLISKIKGKPISEIKPSTPEPTEEESGNKPVAPVRPAIDFKHKSNSVEVKKISSGLMLAQCYNSDSDTSDDDDKEGEDKDQDKVKDNVSVSKNLEKFDLPVPPDDLQTIIDKTAAYVAKNGKDFEDILRTEKDPRFAFLEDSSPYHRYYIYKVTGTIYLPATISPQKNGNGTAAATNGLHVEDKPSVAQPVSFTIRPQKREEASAELQTTADVRLINDSDEEEEEEEDRHKQQKREEQEEEDESLSVAELLEREERKEIRRVEERVRDKLAAAAREKLGLISKEKQLQLERKKKAMAFLLQIKKNGEGSTASTSAEGSSTNDANDAVKSDGAKEVCSIVVADHPTEVERDKRSRSRRSSRSRSPSVERRSYRDRRRSRTRSRSRGKSKRKKRSADKERREGRNGGRDRKKSRYHQRRRSSSNSDGGGPSRNRSRSRSKSRSRGSRERSRIR